MGNPNSKSDDSVSDDFHGNESLPFTPISNAKLGTVDLDPRSPSANVIRTPIEVITICIYFSYIIASKSSRLFPKLCNIFWVCGFNVTNLMLLLCEKLG